MRLQHVSQEEACEIIESAKEEVTGSKFYGDHPKDELIQDLLDIVVGWCPPDAHIWNPVNDAKRKLDQLVRDEPGGGIEPNDGAIG